MGRMTGIIAGLLVAALAAPARALAERAAAML